LSGFLYLVVVFGTLTPGPSPLKGEGSVISPLSLEGRGAGGEGDQKYWH